MSNHHIEKTGEGQAEKSEHSTSFGVEMLAESRTIFINCKFKIFAEDIDEYKLFRYCFLLGSQMEYFTNQLITERMGIDQLVIYIHVVWVFFTGGNDLSLERPV